MKTSKLWAITTLVALTTTAGSMHSNSAEQPTSLKSSIAKDMLYSNVERRGYSWSSPASNTRQDASTMNTNVSNSVERADWETSSANRNPQRYETVTVADQSSYKWGIRATADQSSYKWGIRATADQSSYKWGIRATADQSSYKWGIRATADQSSYKWGIR